MEYHPMAILASQNLLGSLPSPNNTIIIQQQNCIGVMEVLSCCCSSSFTPTNLITSSKQSTTKLQTSSSSSSLKPTINLTTKTNISFTSYAKYKPITDTLRLFHLLPAQDTVTWNILLSACSKQAHFTTTIYLFLKMIISGVNQPDTITFRCVLKSCFQTMNYSLFTQTHAYMIKLFGLCIPDLVTNTCLINFYNEFESIEVARKLFDKMPSRDIVAFNSMMVGYTSVGDYEEALRMFRIMLVVENLIPNEFVYTCVLSASAGLSSLIEGEQIHARIVKSSMSSDVFVGTALINMYTKCNRMGCAEKAFLEIDTPNVVSWNALMSGNYGGRKVIEFLSELRDSGLFPDHVTFANVLRNCKDVSLFSVQQIHGLIMKMIEEELDMFIGGALVEIYADHGFITDAVKIFHGIHEKDITAFNLAMQGFTRNGYTAEAIKLFYEFLEIGMEPNEATLRSLMVRIEGLDQGKQFHALSVKFGFSDHNEGDGSIASLLILMYTEFDCFQDAIEMFLQIQSPDLVLWTSLISGFSRRGESQEALGLYTLMLEKLAEPPNHYTFSSVLSSCSRLAAVEEGKQIHGQIIKSNSSIQSDIFVINSLLDMYAKSGYIAEARLLFDKMPKRDIVAWNAMITGLAQHGYTETAMEIFQQLLNLPDLEPNHSTYVGVLSACSHGGLLKDGYQYFKLIKDPTIDHYTCLIDLLGRAGQLDEALNVVQQMPFDPNEVIWSSLLAASVMHGNLNVGEYSAQHLFQLNPKDPGTYIALSNIYASMGRWEDVNMVRKLMKKEGVKKNPGKSWLRLNGRTHVFVAVDSRHGKIT